MSNLLTTMMMCRAVMLEQSSRLGSPSGDAGSVDLAAAFHEQ
jgi:hypothetical protein